jgi:hypothetical protein
MKPFPGSISETSKLLQRFPSFELSYETISHKKVSPNYQIALAIPHGKKYYAWFSYYNRQNVVYWMELNKDKKVVKINMTYSDTECALSHDTILYGVLLTREEDAQFIFLVEDVLFYKGFPMKSLTFGEKLPWIQEFFEKIKTSCLQNCFAIPAFWSVDVEKIDNCAILPDIYKQLPYVVHHIQYRSLTDTVPFVNYPLKVFNVKSNSTINTNVNARVMGSASARPSTIHIQTELFRPDFSKPQYRFRTIFQISADIQYDIYHLYVCGKNKSMVYYNVAYIPSYKTSVTMNSLFRNIKENHNLDYIEESEDENEFENVAEDKYVNLQKTLFMECKFYPKFKRWIPLRVLNAPCKVVHASQL